jgi:hypothetical protein
VLLHFGLEVPNQDYRKLENLPEQVLKSFMWCKQCVVGHYHVTGVLLTTIQIVCPNNDQRWLLHRQDRSLPKLPSVCPKSQCHHLSQVCHEFYLGETGTLPCY